MLRRLFIMLVILVSLICISANMLMAQDDDTVSETPTCDPSIDYETSALETANSNNFADAIPLYTCAIEQDPANASLFGARGLAYMFVGDTVSAVTDYQHYEDLTGAFAPFMQAQINRFFVTTPPFLQSTEAQTVTADTPQAHYDLGLQYFQQGDFENAILEYNNAINLDPNNAIYYGARGLTYVQFGAPEFAMADFQSYERLTGELEPYMRQIMDVLNTDETFGAQSVPDAPEIIMGDANSYYERGIFFQQNGEVDRAILDFNTAVGLDPQQASYYSARGFAFILINEPTLALRDYDRYRGITGDYAPFMQQQLPALQRLIDAQNAASAEQSSG